VLSLLLVALTGCASDGDSTFVSFYEGLTGNEWSPSPVQAVRMSFDAENADRRRKGILYLSSASFGGEEEYVASYRLFVTDPDAGVRAAAAAALGKHGTVQDVILITPLLSDEEPLVRWSAADALRKVHNPVAAEPLSLRLDPETEDDADARAAAAAALGQYPDRAVFSRLVTALEDSSYTVVSNAHRSLVLLTGYDAGQDPRDWSNWAQTNPDLFAHQRPYTYTLYQLSPDWVDTYVTFWNNQDTPASPPRGIDEVK